MYEKVFEAACGMVGKKKSELVGSQKVILDLGSGVIAGMSAAVISQPADTLLSKVRLLSLESYR